MLVQNRQRVMEKDELMKTLWPDSFVEEANLAQNISTLRKALGESPGDHRYIVTVPGRGYQFVAEVRSADEEPQDCKADPAVQGPLHLNELYEEAVQTSTRSGW